MSDVLELVRVRQVTAVPGQKEMAVVVGGQCQVECITSRISRHDVALYVGIHDAVDLLLDREKGETGQERQSSI
jgi:hypothetical protein